MTDVKMRPSRVLNKLRSGQVAHSLMVNLTCPRVIDVAGGFGFDCFWTCMEHGAKDWSVIERQVMAAKSHEVDLVCRVARGGYSDYIRPLELDATGIMVPHVMNLADARDVVRMTRFHPLGRRPLDGGNADGAYCRIPTEEYIKQANENRFVILQIEDPEALEDLDAIAELDGYEILFFGAGDFSHAIGEPGRMDHPLIVKTQKKIAELANRNGKFAGASCAAAQASRLKDLGYTFLNVGADVLGIGKYCSELAEICGLEIR